MQAKEALVRVKPAAMQNGRVLVCSKKGTGTVTAVNGEMDIEASFESPGMGDLNAAVDSNICRIADMLPDEGLRFRAAKDILRLSAGPSRYAFNTAAPGTVPAIPFKDSYEFSVGGQALADALTFVVRAVGNDMLRPYLNGVNLSHRKGSGLMVTATNGHLLARATIPVKGKLEPFSKTVPVRPVKEVMTEATNTENVAVSVAPNAIRFIPANDVRITSRLMDGDYPDVEPHLRKHDRKQFIHAAANDLVQALNRMATMAEHGAVQMVVEDGYIVLQGRDESKEGRERIGAKTPAALRGVKSTFNALFLRYAVAACGALSDNVRVSVVDAERPAVIRPEAGDAVWIVMPVRM